MAWPTLLDCRLRELLAHWQIITESESIKEPRGRSRSQSYSQIALLHSHLFLHDQLTFADISGTDNAYRLPGRGVGQVYPWFHSGQCLNVLGKEDQNGKELLRNSRCEFECNRGGG
jgi:hypothetical protein